MGTCPYGASVAPGKDPLAQVVISRALWEQLTGTASSWMDGLLDTFAPTVVNVSTLCSLNVEDPADLSVTQIASAFAGEPVALLEAEQWAKAKLSYLAFVNNCVCNKPPGALACNVQQESAGGWTRGGALSGREIEGFRFTALKTVCKGGWLYTATGGGWTAQIVDLWDVSAGTEMISQTVLTPGGANSVVQFEWSTHQNLTVGHDYIIGIKKESLEAYPFKATGTLSVATFYTGVSQVYSTSWSTMPATASGARIGLEPEVCAPDTTGTTPTAVTEPTQPTTLILPPAWTCTTACDTMVRLQQISDRLDWLRRDVTLLQRYSAPFGYTFGAANTGLTGTGSIVLSRCIGFQVVLEASPAGGRVLPGDPVYLWNLGWMAINDPEGMLAEKRLTRQSTVWMPDDCQLATTFTYYLNPGVQIGVVPLLAEP